MFYNSIKSISTRRKTALTCFSVFFLILLISITWAENPQNTTQITKIAVKNDHTLLLDKDGGLWGWGSNITNQVTDGPQNSKLPNGAGIIATPFLISADKDWNRIAVGMSHSIAIRNNGTLWGWGSNSSGELGLGEKTYNKGTPFKINNASDWADVTCGSHFTIALKNDGTLWGWGDNDLGQLGIGDSKRKTKPTQIGKDNNWAKITCGIAHVLAIKTDGTLWGWGDNIKYQLGLGIKDQSTKNKPTRIGKDSDWTMITAGQNHSVGLKNDGTLFSWGDNNFGQLGTGNQSDCFKPTQIGNDTNWSIITAGFFHTIALKTDGSLWIWGDNTNNQLGILIIDNKFAVNGNIVISPIRVEKDNDWKAISGGHDFTIATKKDNTVWVWGNNERMRLNIKGLPNTKVITLPTELPLKNK